MCDKKHKKPYDQAKEDFKKSKEKLEKSIEKGNQVCEFLKSIMGINLTPASGVKKKEYESSH